MAMQAAQTPATIENLTDTNGAAQYLNIPAKTLQKWRSTGYQNITYIRIGRKIRYRYADLKSFVEANLVGDAT
jgi:excisionase family DNA binding protein